MALHELGGACSCGRGPVIGTCAFTGGRMWFRAFHDGLPAWHHAGTAEQACVDCVADIALAVASGEIRTAMRRIAMKHRGVRYCGECARTEGDGYGAVFDDDYSGVCKDCRRSNSRMRPAGVSMSVAPCTRTDGGPGCVALA